MSSTGKRLSKAEMKAYLKWARANKWAHVIAFMKLVK